jgi:hypothetical protein
MVGSGLDPDTAFALLSNRRRRQLLYLLARSDGMRSLQAVTRELVGRLEGVAPDEVDDETYRSVYVSLYQRHVPRLAASGVVEYDEAERRVRLAHDRRTETLLRIVDIDLIGSRPVGRRTRVLLTGAAVGATVCGVLALVDPIWLVPWAAVVAGLLAFQVRRYAGAALPVDDGPPAAGGRSPADVVDDDSHPDHRQEDGHGEREVEG